MFNEKLQAISDLDITLRVGASEGIYGQNDDWDEDFYITVNLASGSVSIDPDDYGWALWNAFKQCLGEYESFEFLATCEEKIVLCEYEKENEEPHALTGVLTNELALEIFREAVAIKAS